MRSRLKPAKSYLSLLLLGFAICCLQCRVFITYASPDTLVRLDYIGTLKYKGNKPLNDTIHSYTDLFKKLTWKVAITNKSGTKQEFITSEIDTIRLNEPLMVRLSSDFIVNPQLLYKVYALVYSLQGSMIVKLNGETILTTGALLTNKYDGLSKLNQDELNYISFIFKDTLQRIEVNYLPYPKKNFIILKMLIQKASIAQEYQKEQLPDKYLSYAACFYYLSYFIIFIVFFTFYREKSENLYFSLFCLFAAISFIWDNFKIDVNVNIGGFMFIFALEFLTIFFCKVLFNRRKSKIPLFINIVLLIISFLPFVSNYYIEFLDQKFQIINGSIIVVLFIYEIFSLLYFLFQGIGQKRWEARVIVLMVLISALVFWVIPPIVMGIISANSTTPNHTVVSVVDTLLNIGLFVYPLSAAIVLGRRNGLNQKKLMLQVSSIQKLSAENIEKEREKKEFFENQNVFLELKVAERTEEVMAQKAIIELKSKSITDNINYALRIQSAILPDIKLIYKTLEQSFILYLPKDIVSGDFYAFSEKDGKAIIIAGDCTGHGVSGAFMSMIGNSLLNHVINEKGITDPALILNELNRNVIETLHQSEQESHDGMDVSVCAFDLAANQLQFAGANRPLWLIRNHELIVFKPNKYPIGGLQMAIDRTFTENQITIQKNDTLYIFSDGFADQFGGAYGKKMMTSRFKEVLLAIQHMPMREQEADLKDYFEKWKGENEQVDDVLVIGVRV